LSISKDLNLCNISLKAVIRIENIDTPMRKKIAPNALSISDRGLISPNPIVDNVVTPK